MNEAVPDIVGAAPVHALPLGLAPGRSGTDFVDRAHSFRSPACRFFDRTGADRIGGTASLQGLHSGRLPPAARNSNSRSLRRSSPRTRGPIPRDLSIIAM